MAIALVQHNKANNGSGTTLALTVSATGAGNLLIAGAIGFNTTTVVSVSDGTSNFTQFPSARSVLTASGTFADVWYLPSSNNGATTITLTLSAGAPKAIFFWEVSGFTTPATDGANIASDQTSAGNQDTGPSVTTTAATGFAVGVVMTDNNVTGNPTAGNEFTAGGDIQATGHAGCSLISASAAAHNPVWDDNGTHGYCASTAAFKESAGASRPVKMAGEWSGFAGTSGGFAG